MELGQYHVQWQALVLGVLNLLVLLPELDVRKKCDDWRWMELALDCVQWQALVLAMFKLLVLLPQRM
jgi:hypothetical protein